MAHVAFGRGDDEAQLSFDQRPLRRGVAALDAAGQRDFLVGRQQRSLSRLSQVKADRVARLGLH